MGGREILADPLKIREKPNLLTGYIRLIGLPRFMIKGNKRWNMGFAIAAIAVLAMPLLPLSSGMAKETDIVVQVDETFEIEIVEALVPFYDWRLTNYDPEYLEFIGATRRPPEDEILGITIKVFTFKALKPGITEIVFTYYQLDVNGEPIKELESRTDTIRILPLLGPILPLEFECNGALYVQTWGILTEGTAVVEFCETNGLTVYALEGIVHETPPQLFIQNVNGDYVIYVRVDMIGQEIMSEQEAIEISKEIEAVEKLIRECTI